MRVREGHALVRIDGKPATVPLDRRWGPVVGRLKMRADTLSGLAGSRSKVKKLKRDVVPAQAAAPSTESKADLRMRQRAAQVALAMQKRAQQIEARAAEAAARRDFRLARKALPGEQKLARQESRQEFKVAKESIKPEARLARQAEKHRFKEAMQAARSEFIDRQMQPEAMLPAEAVPGQVTPAVLAPENELEPEAAFEVPSQEASDTWFEDETSVDQEQEEPEPEGVDFFDEETVDDQESPWDQGVMDDVGGEELEGLGTPFVASISMRWNELAAWLQAKVGQFLQMKQQILINQRLLQEAIAKSRATGQGDLDRLEELSDQTSEALETQKKLEVKVLDMMQKIQGTKSTQQGVGLFPFVIGAAAVVALAGITAAVYIHMRSWDEIAKETELVTKGLLSVSDLERIKKSGSDPLGLSNVKTIGLIALAGVALWMLPKLIGSRSQAA